MSDVGSTAYSMELAEAQCIAAQSGYRHAAARNTSHCPDSCCSSSGSWQLAVAAVVSRRQHKSTVANNSSWQVAGVRYSRGLGTADSLHQQQRQQAVQQAVFSRAVATGFDYGLGVATRPLDDHHWCLHGKSRLQADVLPRLFPMAGTVWNSMACTVSRTPAASTRTMAFCRLHDMYCCLFSRLSLPPSGQCLTHCSVAVCCAASASCATIEGYWSLKPQASTSHVLD